MDSGIENAALLSLLGGNERDSGLQSDNTLQWWGNLTESNPNRVYRSELQNLIRDLPLTTGNMRRIDEAAKRDLAWLVDAGLVSGIGTRVTMPGIEHVRIEIALAVQDRIFRFALSYLGGEFKLVRSGPG